MSCAMWARCPYNCSIASATDATSTVRYPSTRDTLAGWAASHAAPTTVTMPTTHAARFIIGAPFPGCGRSTSDPQPPVLQGHRRGVSSGKPDTAPDDDRGLDGGRRGAPWLRSFSGSLARRHRVVRGCAAAAPRQGVRREERFQHQPAGVDQRRRRARQLLAIPGAAGAGAVQPSAATTPDVAPATASVYESIGVRPLINARGTFTIISGSLMLPEVRAAMDAAAQHYVHLDELTEAIGARLAALTGAEWGMVSSGCSAALTHATAACVAGGNPDLHVRIPNLTRVSEGRSHHPDALAQRLRRGGPRRRRARRRGRARPRARGGVRSADRDGLHPRRTRTPTRARSA